MNRGVKIAKVLVIVALAVVVFGFVTMRLWNWLMPPLFGLRMITFAQAIGLLVLSKILLGGFHKHGPGPGFARRRAWKRRMKERWAAMSPEERERFREAMRHKWGCGFGNAEPKAEEKGVAQ